LLVSTLTGGKDTWRDFALSVVRDMLKLQIETQILGPLMKALAPATSGMGGGLGSIIGGLMLRPHCFGREGPFSLHRVQDGR